MRRLVAGIIGLFIASLGWSARRPDHRGRDGTQTQLPAARPLTPAYTLLAFLGLLQEPWPSSNRFG
jgi:hypothetical protein